MFSSEITYSNAAQISASLLNDVLNNTVFSCCQKEASDCTSLDISDEADTLLQCRGKQHCVMYASCDMAAIHGEQSKKITHSTPVKIISV